MEAAPGAVEDVWVVALAVALPAWVGVEMVAETTVAVMVVAATEEVQVAE